MVTDSSVHTDNEARRKLSQKEEQDFFRRKDTGKGKTTVGETQRAYQLLLENPDMTKLILAALGRTNAS